jgi:hypothetical protein
MWRETLSQMVRNHKFQLAACGLASATVGSSVGYAVARKLLEKKYAELATAEIRQAKEFYEMHAPKEIVVEESPFPDIDDGDVLAAAQALLRYQGRTDEQLLEGVREATEAADPTPEALTVVKNIFDHPTPAGEAVLGALIDDRSPDVPYVITKDEFYENEYEFTERQLTWYEGDKTLADEQDVPVPAVERIVGEDNLLRFGWGSGDDTIVYVRNEKMKLNLEISKSTGKFAHEVAGFGQTDHLEHGDRPARRKRRFDD